jgi:ribonuclease P protein component
MLPRANRVVTAVDFRGTLRKGRRVSTSSAQVYVVRQASSGPTRFGFIVSKAVGNSVTRNLVTRRLRSIGRDYVRSQPIGFDVVIRALPGSPAVSWATLQSEILNGLERSTAP